jgi:putative transposase
MPRIARLVVPNVPHHITQRGNHREPVFFEDGDQARYLSFLKASAQDSQSSIWAYCLMPNHVHLIVAPSHKDGLRDMFAESHRQYTNFINWRHNWTGHLWQGRFGSVAMDENHLGEAVRYIAQNPVRAGLVSAAEDWPFSSARAHLSGKNDGIVEVAPILSRFPDFAALIGIGEQIGEFDPLRRAETSGRPLGSGKWIKTIEEMTGRSLKRGSR